MSVLKSLSFIALPKGVGSDPKLSRRRKLITQLQQQRALAEDGSYVVQRQKWVKQANGAKALVDAPKRVKRWWRDDGAGNMLLVVRYGSKVLELSKGAPAIAIGEKHKLTEVIDSVIAAVTAGELDSLIEATQKAGQKPKRKAT
jgi:hypothetical protein